MASYVQLLPSLLEIVKVAGQLAEIQTLLVHLCLFMLTSMPTSSKSSRLQAPISLSPSSHCPPGKTMLSLYKRSYKHCDRLSIPPVV